MRDSHNDLIAKHEQYMMFLNDEKFKEVETWLNDCTNEYTNLLFVANDYMKHYRANTNWPGKAGQPG